MPTLYLDFLAAVAETEINSPTFLDDASLPDDYEP
jgi:hypothetical protein